MGSCSMTGGLAMMGGGWSMMLFGFLATVAVWGLLIYVGVRIYRSWQGGTTRAEDTLARRFAAGEIDEDEYHRRLDTLRSTTAGASWPTRA